MPRDRGGSVTLSEGTGGIVSMCPCEHFLEVYKVDATFRIESPETIDPARTNPNAPFVAAVADHIGSGHPIVARVLLQGREILQSAIFASAVDLDAVINRLHAVKEALVACHKASEHISRHVEAVEARWKEQQADSRGGHRVIPSLPQVPDLEPMATQFLVNAKRAIAGICGLAPLFLQLERTDNNLDHLGDRIAALLGDQAALTLFLRDYADSARYVIDLRNAQEHPKAGRVTHIQNVRIQPDGSPAAPVWFVTGATPRPIHVETAAAINRIMEMAELMLIFLVDQRLDPRWPFAIEEVPDSERNPSQPIRFRLSIDMSRLRSKST